MLGRRKVKGDKESGKRSISPPAAKRIKEHVEELEEDNKNGSSLSPMEKALQNTLVLQNIFKFLPYKDLQACRYVELPLWSSEAQHAIRQRSVLDIELHGSQITMTKTVDCRRIGFQVDGIANLPVQLENHGKGQEIWLSLTKFDATSEDWQKFVEKFGYAVSYLKFSHRSLDRMLRNDFQKLLSRFPNLSHLCLKTLISSEWHSNKEIVPGKSSGSSSNSFEQFLLPEIKTVSFGYENRHQKPLMGFFEMISNLKNVLSVNLCFIPKSAPDDQLKLNKIRSIMFPRFKNYSYEVTAAELSKLENLSYEIGLQMAQFPQNILRQGNSNEEQTSCFRSWSSVLRNNQDTLEYLIIEPAVLPELLEYPEMKAVKKICLYSPDHYSNMKPTKFFAKGFDAGKTFPNLTQVILKTGISKLFQYVKFFPADAFSGNVFQGVTSIELQASMFGDLDSLKKIALLFPNVTSFSIKRHLPWQENGLDQILWWWPNLRSLKLKLNVSNNCTHQKFPLDSVFTGISPSKCNQLRKNGEKMDIDIEKYRQELAISNMKDLKELTLVFGGGQSWTRYGQLFSHVTPFYGFQLLPDLKVTFAIPWDSEFKKEIREMLSPMEKYVIFNPDYCEPDDYYPKPPMYGYWR